jgi:hypothetical protein
MLDNISLIPGRWVGQIIRRRLLAMAEAPNNANKTIEIKDETTYQAAMRTLGNQDRPPAILRFLMGAFESYRQSRKIGWSRPWNKYGINTFLSFKLDFPRDADLIERARAVLADEAGAMPGAARNFVDDLFADGNLMGFIFMQEYSEDGRRYESVTLSFGRKTQKRYRDRLDLILEAPIAGSTVGAFSRLRLFVDPYAEQKEPIWQNTFEAVSSENAADLFRHLGDLSWQWAGDKTRIWDHWTSRYIDYFGPRQWSLDDSNFAPFGSGDSRPERLSSL